MPHWRNRRPGLISADRSWAKVTVHAGIAIGVTIAVGVGVYLVLPVYPVIGRRLAGSRFSGWGAERCPVNAHSTARFCFRPVVSS
jgi:hypothetical protein